MNFASTIAFATLLMISNPHAEERPAAASIELRAALPHDHPAVISAADILSYDWRTHTLHLRPGVIARLRNALASHLAGGVPFHLRLGEEVLYAGVFTTSISSYSQSLPVVLLDGNDTATIQLGYPTQKNFRGEDPRANKRLQAALNAAGLLQK